VGSKILCRDQALALKLMVNSDLSIVSKGKRSLMAKLIGIARRCVLAALLCLAPLVLAQNPTGVLRGIVLDSSGARISAAKIEIHLPGAAIARTILCDARGEFRMDDLPPGTYQVGVTAPGFSAADANVAVGVNAIRDIKVTLQPSAVQQVVGAQARGSSITEQPLDQASSVHQAIATSQDLESLPLPARSFANIAYLAPGTEPVTITVMRD
jgi:hypothetical protein